MTHPLEDENRRLREALEEADRLLKWADRNGFFPEEAEIVIERIAALAAEPARGEAGVNKKLSTDGYDVNEYIDGQREECPQCAERRREEEERVFAATKGSTP